MAPSPRSTKRVSDHVHPELSIGRWIPSVPMWNIICRAIFAVIGYLITLFARSPSHLSTHVIHIFSTDEKATIETYIARPKSAPLPTGEKRPLLPGILWIHGGGLISGTYGMESKFIHRFATPSSKYLPSGAVVVSPNYRLATVQPAPAPGDDCFAAWLWMVEHAEELGIDTDKMVIAGVSAGAGMAALLAQRILDYNQSTQSKNHPFPVLQLLIYPMLDDRTVSRLTAELSSGYIAQSHYPLWSPSNNKYGWTKYLGGKTGTGALVPARREDLAGLPPAWIGVGTLDLFYAEDKEYARRLKEAGVEVTLEVVEGGWHGFDGLCPNTDVVREFQASQARMLREKLGI